jgi:nitrate/TMAO reductase-like tetraheme cytochrome c subunit
MDEQQPVEAGDAATPPPLTAPAEPAADATPPETPKPPKQKRSARYRWILGGSIFAGVIVILVIAAFLTSLYTNRSEFCDTCHEMRGYVASWKDSVHDNIDCEDCHIPPGASSYVLTKLGSFREIWVHLTGSAKAPLAVTREISNATCLRCHSNRPSDPKLTNVIFSHGKHPGVDCIRCHQRVVHREVNPPYYQDPGSKGACLQCHDGTTAPNACTTCHTPPHEEHQGKCEDCHNTLIWKGPAFDHPFPLSGGHANIRCIDCHHAKQGTTGIPGTDLANADPDCASCHGDHHEAQGLKECGSCHTVEGWQKTTFTHAKVGKHMPDGPKFIKCTDCHKAGFDREGTCDPCHKERPKED